MPIALRAASTSGQSAATVTSTTVTFTAGATVGDLLVVAMNTRNGNVDVTVTPTGWTRHQYLGSTGNNNGAIYTRLYQAGDGTSVAFSFTTSSKLAWGCAALTGVDQTTPLDVAVAGGIFALPATATTAVPFSTVSVVTAGAAYLGIIGQIAATANFTPGAGLTEQWDISNAATAANRASSAAGYELLAATGTTNRNFTQTTALAGIQWVVVARPASTGPVEAPKRLLLLGVGD